MMVAKCWGKGKMGFSLINGRKVAVQLSKMKNSRDALYNPVPIINNNYCTPKIFLRVDFTLSVLTTTK